MMHRRDISRSRRIVVKIGSAMLTANGKGLDQAAMRAWVSQIVGWLDDCHQLVIVSSGAVAEGMTRMGWQNRPETLHQVQAAAAIGQMGLVHAWESAFSEYGKHTAQVLLTHDDLRNRSRYLNARNTLETLLAMGVVPVINENDAVAYDELQFGDNDTLAALVANLIGADVLILLTDQDGLFDQDPRDNPLAQLISHSRVDNEKLDVVAGAGGKFGRGGMVTKVRAARVAARSGTSTIIASGGQENILARVLSGEDVGTMLSSAQTPDASRKQWLAGQLKPAGCLILDDGAVRMLRASGASLLAVGIVAVEGDFKRGDVVVCRDQLGHDVARGLVNYSAEEISQIKGCSSNGISDILGYLTEDEVIHRNNLALCLQAK